MTGCLKCKGLRECVCCLPPTANSGKGSGATQPAVDKDVWQRMQMPLGYRLARGFAILRGGSA